MPTTTVILKYNIADGLIISPSELISEYLHGIPLTDTNGKSYPSKEIRKKIKEATVVIENFLKMKIIETEITEEQDYIHEEWMNWGHIKLHYKPNEILSVSGYLNDQRVVDFDKTMWVMKGKNIALVPGAHNLVSTIWFNNAGVYPILRSGVRMVPNFFHISYKTGFVAIPEDILLAVSKYASISILAVLGDILLGAGIASESISFDGLSQSIGTTQSAENSAYSARIKQYAGELKEHLNRLKNYYRGIIFEVA